MAGDGIAVRVEGRVAVVTLDRPQRRNALCAEMVTALSGAFGCIEADPAIGAAVLTGAAPAFCSGSDLKELGALDVGGMQRHQARTAAVARSIGGLSLPVVAAVEGHALGGGFILAASCDIVVTAADTRWHLPEVANGWLPPWGLGALTARVGAVKARMLTWGAEPIDGSEAFRIGVADAIATPGQSLGRAMDIAARLAALPRPAAATVKRFFEPLMAVTGEHLDHTASRMFGDDCRSGAAGATLARFGRQE